MTMKNYILAITMVLMLSGAVCAQKVSGVWRLDEVKTSGTTGETVKFTQPNMYLFTKSHFSIIRVQGADSRSKDDPAKMTAEQLLTTYVRSFVANAGTYDMKGGTLTMKVIVAKSPIFMTSGNWSSYKVSITGNQMTLTSTATNDGPTKDPAVFTLTRME